MSIGLRTPINHPRSAQRHHAHLTPPRHRGGKSGAKQNTGALTLVTKDFSLLAVGKKVVSDCLLSTRDISDTAQRR